MSERNTESEPILTSNGENSNNNDYNSIDNNTTNTKSNKNINDLVTTSNRQEYRFLIKSTVPVSLTFLLEYFLSATTIFVIGHLGSSELAAMSLVNVTVGVSGYAIIIGIATCLDTLAAQAYGRGDYKMVGIHTQRCALFLFLLNIPLCLLWIYSKPLLKLIVPQPELREMAPQCLRIFALGLPGYTIFEVAKHYLQVQNNFHAPTYILIAVTPLNILLNYFLVWDERFGFGIYGAPIAVATIDWVMAIMLLLYIKYVDGMKCWTPITMAAFKDWWQMIRFAVSGVIMVEAEWLAFDFLTMASSQFGTNILAAQSVMTTLMSLSYQIPMSMGIACCTRVGNLIGAGAPEAAKRAANTGLKGSLFTGGFNAIMSYLFRYQIGKIFTNEERVLEIIAATIPIAALVQFNDSLGAVTGGVLRGQGRQYIGSIVNVVGYYGIMVPLAWFFAFNLGFELKGLWSGMLIGLLLVSSAQLFFVKISSWEKICEDTSENVSS